MANYPNGIYQPREIENLPGLEFDAENKTTLFAEDKSASDAEIVAIEETLGEDVNGEFETLDDRINALTGTIAPMKLLGIDQKNYRSSGGRTTWSATGTLSVPGVSDYVYDNTGDNDCWLDFTLTVMIQKQSGTSQVSLHVNDGSSTLTPVIYNDLAGNWLTAGLSGIVKVPAGTSKTLYLGVNRGGTGVGALANSSSDSDLYIPKLVVRIYEEI